MKSIMKRLFLIIGTLFCAGTVQATTYYVDGSVETSGDGSKSSPVKTVKEGVDLAIQTGDKVEIAANTYALASTLTITNGITIYGATGNPADVILDAKKNKTAIYIPSAAGNAVFHSLTVTGGQSVNGAGTEDNNRGGGFTIRSAAVVSNCVITGCINGSNGGGVGLLINNSKAILTHSRVANNGDAGAGRGSGIRLVNGTVVDCLIIGNGVKGKAYGGGLDVEGGKVVNCTIAGNKAKEGGGIYFSSGSFYNLAIYGNDATTGPEVCYKYGSASSYGATSKIACSVAFGANTILLAASPFTSTYEINPSTGSALINAGDNSKIVSSKDYFGNARIFDGDGVGVVDIGAHEYSKIEIVPGIIPNKTTGTGPTAIELKASVTGTTLSDCTCAWYADDSATPFSTAAVCTNTFAVGKHSLKLVLTHGGTDYAEEKPEGYITIYPTDAYVDLAGTDPVWPYDTKAHAATNLETAVSEVLKSGVTLHVPAGSYPLKGTLNIGAGARLVGAGRDKTIIYNPNPATCKFRNFYINGAGAYVSGVCVSNAHSGTVEGGAGVCIDTAGGTFEDGSIVYCQGGQNGDGAGAYLAGSSSVMRRTVIANNFTETKVGNPKGSFIGGGVKLTARALLEDCLVIGNEALSAAGVWTSGAFVRNCTIVGNVAGANSYGNNCIGGGGLSAVASSEKDWSIDNCIIWGNRDMSIAATETNILHDVAGEYYKLTRCCLPVASGNKPLVANPMFRNAAAKDYRLDHFSPCRKAGVWQTWMATATDLWGNPRAGKRHVDIGCHQSEPDGLMLLVR